MTRTNRSEFFSGVIFKLGWLRRVSRKGDTIKGFMKTQRTIKFRAWDKANMKWIYIVIDPENTRIDYGGDKKHNWLQFTGLLDKNGKEIYEGDIVNCITRHGIQISPVEWGDAGGAWNLPDVRGAYLLLDVKETIEVLGNIYENPELLK
jgi:hypothetical protein